MGALLAGLDTADTVDEQLAETWVAALELRLLYCCPDRARAEQHLYAWLFALARGIALIVLALRVRSVARSIGSALGAR